MKKIVQFLFLFFFTSQGFAQNFTGQWKGQFTDNSTSFVGWGGDRCDYVLEIECRGTKVTGYSYTYFSDGGKLYYTICRLKGTLNKASKYIEIIEIERTKTNVPVTIRNCFQIHRLTYFNQDNVQTLEGTWIPAPNQEGDCGFGSTILSRRVLQKNPFVANTVKPKVKKPKTTVPLVKPKPKKTEAAPIVKIKPKPLPPPPAVKKTNPVEKPVASDGKTIPVETDNTAKKDAVNPQKNKEKIAENKIAGTVFEKRNTELIKTIEIDNETFDVNLYDNGEIDGDSISLMFNGRVILSKKRLSDKAINLKLSVDETKDINELIMYAENLGTIPPNTALMVVTDGTNRYEVRISSDLQKSGVIRFIHKSKNKQ